MANNIIEIADFFKTLGDPTRLKLIRLLLSYNNLCVGMIAKKLKITQPAVSQHLRILKNKGIVEGKRMGYYVHYQVNNDIFEKFGLRLNKIIKKTEKDCELEERCKTSPI